MIFRFYALMYLLWSYTVHATPFTLWADAKVHCDLGSIATTKIRAFRTSYSMRYGNAGYMLLFHARRRYSKPAENSIMFEHFVCVRSQVTGVVRGRSLWTFNQIRTFSLASAAIRALRGCVRFDIRNHPEHLIGFEKFSSLQAAVSAVVRPRGRFDSRNFQNIRHVSESFLAHAAVSAVAMTCPIHSLVSTH